MWAVIPVKDLTDAKQRLSGMLAPHERRELFLAMLHDVLRAISSAKGLKGCLMVTRDSTAILLAKEIDARILLEAANEGQSAAVQRAARLLAEEGAEGMLTVPGDVPLLTPADIELALNSSRSIPGLTLVSSRDGRGSNCLVVRPADVMPFQFGSDSFAKHLAVARERNLAVDCVDIPGFAHDVDEPADLVGLLETLHAGHTREFLDASNVRERVLARSSVPDPAT
jgi:2-phospho-L-lactate guanylyltransferase